LLPQNLLFLRNHIDSFCILFMEVNGGTKPP
jgi:hypothetical protein